MILLAALVIKLFTSVSCDSSSHRYRTLLFLQNSSVQTIMIKKRFISPLVTPGWTV